MATANNEFFEALAALEKERGLPADYLIEKIKAAIVIAVKKDYEVEDDNVVVDIDPELGAFRASLLRDIVEEVENPHTQVSLEDAQKIRKSYKVGQRMVTPLKTKEFGRIAAQTAKYVIRQGLREGERNLQCSEMQSRAHELITATVVSIDPERGNIVLDLGKVGSAVLPRNEQVPGETFTEGQTVQVYVVDVLATDRGPRVTISRTHPGLVKRMFELEVPEIYDGTVEVKAIAREAERNQQLSEIQSRAHDIVQATVTRVDTEKGIVALDLGKGGEAVLPRNEQVPGEVYTEGETLQVYIVDVVSTERGPRVMISRTHPGLVKRLFELEVPEIFDGTVEVKAISREAGARTKMAVWSKDPNVNPVSACIGEHGARVAAVVEKLGGEKIDIVKWSEDISEFISAALSPAKVVKVELLPGETRSCRVTVPDQQLSLAIGNKGQNARLCARLTGYNIDIRPESGYYGEDEEPKKDATDAE